MDADNGGALWYLHLGVLMAGEVGRALAIGAGLAQSAHESPLCLGPLNKQG